MKSIYFLLFFVFMCFLFSCTHKRVEVHKVTDYSMTCSQIIEEMKKVEKIKTDIKNKKGFSGRNVGMALFFWPGVIVNEVNANKALELADKRLDVLNKLYKEKECDKKLSK